MESIWDMLIKFYGLDWIGMSMSFYGTYLITKRDRMGFVYCIMSCISGGTVSYLADVPSYVVCNMIFFAINIKGYWSWRNEAKSETIAHQAHDYEALPALASQSR